MNVLGIIAEYNPFHNGHRYHLEQARQKACADGVVCVMSGNFVQRGEPAIVDKWARAQMALNQGVDLVFELPVLYATRSAYWFAKGGVLSFTAPESFRTLPLGWKRLSLPSSRKSPNSWPTNRLPFKSSSGRN